MKKLIKRTKVAQLQFEDLWMLKLIIFTLGTFFLATLSRRSLQNRRSHGFYRFISFEGILILLLMNYSFWVINPYSLLQLLSWLLLFLSILLVGQGLYFLKKAGGQSEVRGMQPENLAFENTTNLVKEGVFNYIRHPMYSSLLLLVWGVFLRNTTVASLLVALITTAFLIATARQEEKENVDFFGADYERYMKTTKMFIPGFI